MERISECTGGGEDYRIQGSDSLQWSPPLKSNKKKIEENPWVVETSWFQQYLSYLLFHILLIGRNQSFFVKFPWRLSLEDIRSWSITVQFWKEEERVYVFNLFHTLFHTFTCSVSNERPCTDPDGNSSLLPFFF